MAGLASWFSHPTFGSTLDRTVEAFTRNEYHFGRLGPVIFVCGGKDSPRRVRLSDYLRRQHTDAHIFWAEDVWRVISNLHEGANALEVENELANFADLVIVIGESVGTFAEIGAFASTLLLRRRLLLILDAKFEDDESFLNTGPIRWIDQDSHYGPTIWTDLDRILGIANELDCRLQRMPKSIARRPKRLEDSGKHLLFFVCDVVAVFGPCQHPEIQDVVSRIVPSAGMTVGQYLALAVAMGVLEAIPTDEGDYFVRPLVDGHLKSFHRTKKFMDIPTLRSKVVAARLRSDEGRRTLFIGNDS